MKPALMRSFAPTMRDADRALTDGRIVDAASGAAPAAINDLRVVERAISQRMLQQRGGLPARLATAGESLPDPDRIGCGASVRTRCSRDATPEPSGVRSTHRHSAACES